MSNIVSEVVAANRRVSVLTAEANLGTRLTEAHHKRRQQTVQQLHSGRLPHASRFRWREPFHEAKRSLRGRLGIEVWN